MHAYLIAIIKLYKCLAKLWPYFQSLSPSSNFFRYCKSLYGDSAVTVQDNLFVLAIG